MPNQDNRPAEANLFFAAEFLKQWFHVMNLPQEEYHKMVARYFELVSRHTKVNVEWHGNIAQLIWNKEAISHIPKLSDAQVYQFPKTYRFSQPK